MKYEVRKVYGKNDQVVVATFADRYHAEQLQNVMMGQRVGAYEVEIWTALN